MDMLKVSLSCGLRDVLDLPVKNNWVPLVEQGQKVPLVELGEEGGFG